MQELEVLFQNRNYSVAYAAQHQLLVITARGVPSFEIAKEAWLEALELAINYKVSKWLNDEQELMILPVEALNWFKTHWFPLAVEKLKHITKPYNATVLSERFYAERSAKSSIESMHQTQEQKFGRVTMTSKSFKSYLEAWHWLTTVDS